LPLTVSRNTSLFFPARKGGKPKTTGTWAGIDDRKGLAFFAVYYTWSGAELSCRFASAWLAGISWILHPGNDLVPSGVNATE
jgi:hypothetical protein